MLKLDDGFSLREQVVELLAFFASSYCFEILIVERLGFFLLCFKFVFAFALSLFFCREPKSGETFTCISMVSSRLSFLSVELLIDRRRTQDLIDFEWLL
jgi:hypothetical protein